MLIRWAADAGSADPSNVFGAILQWGVPGIVLVLILLGWLIPKGAHEQMKADRDTWRSAYETERDAHQATRDAFIDASRAANAAVETARTATGLLDKLGHPTHPGGYVS
ncbi:hypothetical protein ACFYUR_18815 [Micromonospora haikouensis]|uniref:hypothetical protein n=1 Tax=Micromonospora haikouensis TaxID=686309 RepID=UPI0036B2A3B0